LNTSSVAASRESACEAIPGKAPGNLAAVCRLLFISRRGFSAGAPLFMEVEREHRPVSQQQIPGG